MAVRRRAPAPLLTGGAWRSSLRRTLRFHPRVPSHLERPGDGRQDPLVEGLPTNSKPRRHPARLDEQLLHLAAVMAPIPTYLNPAAVLVLVSCDLCLVRASKCRRGVWVGESPQWVWTGDRDPHSEIPLMATSSSASSFGALSDQPTSRSLALVLNWIPCAFPLQGPPIRDSVTLL